MRLDLAGEQRLSGCPGSGKTTALIAAIKQAEPEVGRDALVVASFTKTAASEIAHRGVPVPSSQAGTLHALAFRALGVRRGDMATGREVATAWSDEHPRWRLSSGSSAPTDDDADAGGDTRRTEGDALLAEAQVLRARMVERSRWPSRVLAFQVGWEDFKANAGLLDFTDLIELARQETTVPVQGAKFGFFDEAQDFTPLELTLVRHWGTNMGRYLLAFDDDQAIFEHVGADPKALLTPIEGERLMLLERSRRVPRAVQAVSERWIAQVDTRTDKHLIPRDAEGSVEFMRGTTWQNPKALVGRLLADVDGGRSPMVLASAAYMLAPLMRIMRDEGLPWRNPYRPGDPHLNPLDGGNGTPTTMRLRDFLNPTVFGRDWTGRELAAWVADIKAAGVLTRGAKTLVDKLGEGLRSGRQEVPRETLEGLFVDAHGAALLDAVDGNDDILLIEWLRAHLLSSRQAAYEFAIAIRERFGQEGLTAKPRVVLGTVHSVKGGEADTVYVIPDMSPAATKAWYGGRASRSSVVRVGYVAMTRTSDRLVLLDAAGEHMPLNRVARDVAGA